MIILSLPTTTRLKLKRASGLMTLSSRVPRGFAANDPFVHRGCSAANEKVVSVLRLPGQYFDSETQLHYNWHRYYDPSLGRYITSDPIGLAGGMNTYGYAYQNPLKYVDPDGRIPLVFAAPAAPKIVAGGAALLAGIACYATNCGQAAVDFASNSMSNDWIDHPDAAAEHQAYKEEYAKPPPPYWGDECERLRWRLRREQKLRDAMKNWDAKWGTNRHAAHIKQTERAIKTLKRKMKKANCGDDLCD